MMKRVVAILAAGTSPVLVATPAFAWLADPSDADASKRAGSGSAASTMAASAAANAPTATASSLDGAVELPPRKATDLIAFSLDDADLGDLVRTISQLTGKRFIFSGNVKSFKASVYAPQKVTVAEAYQAFLSILESNKLTVIPHGRFLKIVETGAVATNETPIHGAHQPSPAEDRWITRLYRMTNISANDAAEVLAKLKSKDADITVYGPTNLLILTDSASNIRRLTKILEEIDEAASGDRIFIEPIHYAAADDIKKRLDDLFGAGQSVPPPSPGTSRRPPRAAQAPAPQAATPENASDLHVAKIVADDRTNSLIIVATEKSYERMLEIIERLDTPQTGEGEIHVVPLQHADATELAKTLSEIIGGTGAAPAAAPGAQGRGARRQVAGPAAAGVEGIFEGGVKVSADKATNALVVTASARDYASIRAVIDRLDQARRQVFIEAVIMDLQLKRSDTLGISFHGGAPFGSGIQADNDSILFGGNKITNTIPPIPTDPDALQGFALGVRGPGVAGSQNFLGTGISIPAFGTFIQAIAQTGDTDLLSTPHILALDNEDAEINVGDNVPLQTNQGFGSLLGGLSGATGAAGGLGGLGALRGLGGLGAFGGVARQDVGTKIKIKPHINDSNQVRLEVTEEISEVGANVGGTSGAFQIGKRTARTKLVVADQQTIVIGGLIRNVVGRTEEKVPLLGDIPVLGALFRKRTNQNEKRNLILVMTPYIIRSQADLRTIFERKMQERQEYLDRYFVFSESTSYDPPKDWSRTNGLLEDIRKAYAAVEEQRLLEEQRRPKPIEAHEPHEPLELPQRMPSPSSTTTPTTPAPAPARRPAAPAQAPVRPLGTQRR